MRNNSTHYKGAIAYRSPITGHHESIHIEVNIREPLLTPAINALARTLLLDPIRSGPIMHDIALNCIGMKEAFAEKFRAALTRREVAIRDFYDLDYAVQHLELDPDDASLVEMVRHKLAVPGNLPVDVTAERFAILKRQLETRLRTVLRDEEYRAFELDRAIQMVVAMSRQL